MAAKGGKSATESVEKAKECRKSNQKIERSTEETIGTFSFSDFQLQNAES